MAPYKRIVDVVDAIQYVAGIAIPGVFGYSAPCSSDCKDRCHEDGVCCVPHIHSSEGPVLIADGDWVLNSNTVVADEFFKTHYTST